MANPGENIGGSIDVQIKYIDSGSGPPIPPGAGTGVPPGGVGPGITPPGGGGRGAPPTPPGGGNDPQIPGGKKPSDDMADMAKTAKASFKFMKGALGLIGIGLTLKGLLKQSKVVGVIFSSIKSLIGAMVDIFLAPFMPLIAKGLQAWAQSIPKIQKFAQKVATVVIEFGTVVAAWIKKLIGIFGEEGWSGVINEIGVQMDKWMTKLASMMIRAFITAMKELISGWFKGLLPTRPTVGSLSKGMIPGIDQTRKSEGGGFGRSPWQNFFSSLPIQLQMVATGLKMVGKTSTANASSKSPITINQYNTINNETIDQEQFRIHAQRGLERVFEGRSWSEYPGGGG